MTGSEKRSLYDASSQSREVSSIVCWIEPLALRFGEVFATAECSDLSVLVPFRSQPVSDCFAYVLSLGFGFRFRFRFEFIFALWPCRARAYIHSYLW